MIFYNIVKYIRHAELVSASHDQCVDCRAGKLARHDVRVAFSLIEAMIILMLISIAVMALIPLVSKSSTPLGWKVSRDNNNAIQFLYFGDKSNSRIGIGVVDPYDTDNPPRGKVVTNNAWIGNTKDIIAANMLGGDVCDAKQEKGIFIRSQSYESGSDPEECTENNIQINNVGSSDLQWIPDASDEANSELKIKSGDKEVISLKTGTAGENEFAIKTADTPQVNILSYANVTGNYTLSTGATTVNIGAGGSEKTLYLGIEQTGSTDDTQYYFNPAIAQTDCTTRFVVGKGCCDTLTVNKTTSAIILGGEYYYDDMCNKQYNVVVGEAECGTTNQLFYNSDSTYPACNYYETATAPTAPTTPDKFYFDFTTPSDKRLKNVLSKYTKSIDDVNKIETYNFTYKNDKKHQLFVGLIAQKIKGIFDEALHTDEKGYLSYEKTPILYAMVNSVKDIFNHQKLIAKKQNKLNKKADKLLKKYGEI